MISFSPQAIAKNFLSLCLGQYGGMFCNMAFSIMLTRLLTPEDFGTLATLLFYLIGFNWLVEWGWEQGFIAHKELDFHEAASTHLIIRAVLGAVPLLTFLGLFALPGRTFLIGDEYYLLALALIYWLEKVGTTYRTILEKKYCLQTLAGIEFFTIILSYLMALAAALVGWGVWSLVIQRACEKGIIALAYGYASPWKGGLAFRWSVMKIFFKSFGLSTWLGGIVSLTIYDFMPFLVGKMSSTYEAGLYAKAFTMATFPVMLTGIFNRLATPLYAQHQYDIPQIRSFFVKMQTIKMLILIPVQLGMAASAPQWIPWLLGTSWIPVIRVYQVMTFYGIMRAFFDDVPGVFLYGFKEPWELTKSQLLQSLIVITIAPIFVRSYQALGGALAMGCMLGIATVLFWYKTCRKLACSWRDFIYCAKTLPTYARVAKSWIIG